MVEIERAGVKDHGMVTALLMNFARAEGWAPEVDRDTWDRVIAELLDSDGWVFLMAKSGSEPVGLAAINLNLTLYGSREQARLTALIVEEGHRRRGTGGRLMEEVLAWARRRGCRELEVSLAPDEGVLDFYARHGYTGRRLLLTWECGER